MDPKRTSAVGMPRWVKVFGTVALIATAILATVHLIDGGTGHFAHSDVGDNTPPAERGSGLP